MQFTAKLSLFLTALTIQIHSSQAATVDPSLEASALKSGYAIRLLKPLPRRNSGCETIFRSGEVLESCEPNYGVDPAIDGVIRNYCEWNLQTHYQKNNPSSWLEPYWNANLITITNAKIGFNHHDQYRTLIQRLRGVESITYRWIELEFNDQITGSTLGSLKCYPSQAYEYDRRKEKLYGNYFYHTNQTKQENEQAIKSGVSIEMISDQLKGYVELLKID